MKNFLPSMLKVRQNLSVCRPEIKKEKDGTVSDYTLALCNGCVCVCVNAKTIIILSDQFPYLKLGDRGQYPTHFNIQYI